MTVLKHIFSWFLLHRVIADLQEFYLQQPCRSNQLDLEVLSVATGLVKLTEHEELYRQYLDCSLTIRAPEGNQLMIQILHLDVEKSKFCKSDYLQIIDGTTNDNKSLEGIDMQWRNGHICGTQTFDKTYISTYNYVTINFTSDGTTEYTGFTLMFTPFHTGDCNVDEFKCENERCIHISLECNDHNNCGDGSNICVDDFTNVAIAVSVVVVLVLVVLIIFSFNCSSVFKTGQTSTSKSNTGSEMMLTETVTSAHAHTSEKSLLTTVCSGRAQDVGSAPLVENEHTRL